MTQDTLAKQERLRQQWEKEMMFNVSPISFEAWLSLREVKQ